MLDEKFSEIKILEMKLFLTFCAIVFAIRAVGQTNSISANETPGRSVETIVCLRHGEKPKGGLGQLTCQGLNRALALPKVLLGKYGKPQFIFAPNPTQKVDGTPGFGGYYYVRPLVTIEPTAIECGLPVNTEFGYAEIDGLQNELKKKEYWKATVFVAWEHGLLDRFVKNLVKANGLDPAKVPIWQGKDYDTIFLIKIVRSNGGESASFTIDHEGLNGLSDACP
jgi:hypothetical protein